VGRSQDGNNNAYCQDNELTWKRWDHSPEARAQLEWTRRMVAFRKAHPLLRRRDYFHGRPIRGRGLKDIAWLSPDGHEMTDARWGETEARAVAMRLAGDASELTDEAGKPVIDDNLLILLNAAGNGVEFRLPPASSQNPWLLAFDSSRPEVPADKERHRGGRYVVGDRAVAVFRQRVPQ
jgi:glycogen operon protein